MPWIDEEHARRVGEALNSVADAIRGSLDAVTDERYYPPSDADAEMVASYLLVMVAMDHRLSRPGKPYEAVINGVKLRGAELLYYLGVKRLKEDPSFFTAERLASITPRDVAEWLCIDSTCPPDIEVRAALLRDLGVKLKLLYSGSALELVRRSKGLLGSPAEPGLIDNLRVFHAYSDPVWKKPLLYAKFIERRGLASYTNDEHERVPVDNHVTRIAIRVGIVKLEPSLEPLTRWVREATPEEDVAIRTAVREAWHIAAREAGLRDFELDDALWTAGRRLCVQREPRCTNCDDHPLCVRGACVLRPLCLAARSGQYPLEHMFLSTWWY